MNLLQNVIPHHMIKSIDQWICEYRNEFDLQTNISLVSALDYSIEFKNDLVGQQSVISVCVCGSKSTLSRHGSNAYLQVSEQNFYLQCGLSLSDLLRFVENREHVMFLLYHQK